jgi:thioredoxin-like negative regulator of GroEL
MEVFSRILIALAIAALGLAVYWLAAQWTLRRAQNKRLGLESASPGLPTILYFTTPTCVPCRTMQGPTLESVAKAHDGDLQVIKIDAQERPEVADHWGVLSVPTIFVLDRRGKPRFFNAGVTRAEKLEQQLMEVS